MATIDPLRSILAATDLQSSSRNVCTLAAALAGAAEARLLLLHVVETRDSWLIPDALEEGANPAEVAEVRRALEVQARELGASGLEVRDDVVEGGSAHQAIIDWVEKEDADLVVVGSTVREGHGHRLGSTADRVLRSTPVPCLIARGDQGPPFRRIAVLTDFSERARHAARIAVAWRDVLGDAGVRMDVVHVGEQVYRNNDPSLEGHMQRKLEEEVEALEGDEGGEPLGRVLRWARHPVDGILEVAEEEGYDLLVVSTHGHGAIRRALVGSVATGLAQSASCPVLVVPASEDG